MNAIKRLFFGVQVIAPWPDEYPKGRLLDVRHRHITLVFLGNVEFQKVIDLLPNLPKPSWKVGLAGRFDKPLFLPPHHKLPRVHAWHIDWIDDCSPLLNFQKDLAAFLKSHAYHMDTRDFLPHTTICRAPFYPREWKASFRVLPCFFNDIHLYESKGSLNYEPVWSYSMISPFEEIEHTADIAFIIRGESMAQIHRHAEIALAFRDPRILDFLPQGRNASSLSECVQLLNDTVCRADAEMGCPFKAVSYHGEITEKNPGILEWEMIVDV